MHIDSLVFRSFKYRNALLELAKSGRLVHVNGQATPFVVDSETIQAFPIQNTVETGGPGHLQTLDDKVTPSLEGHTVLGCAFPGDIFFGLLLKASVVIVPCFVMPYYDGSMHGMYFRERSSEDLVRSFAGVRCYRIEKLTGAQEPASLIISDEWSPEIRLQFPELQPLAELGRAGGLASRDASSVLVPNGDWDWTDVTGKHVLDMHGSLPWETAARADRITDLTWIRGSHPTIHQQHLSRLQAEETRDAECEWLRGTTMTYRVHELQPEELDEL